ncbi:DUF445 domain-containing protein [Alkalimarinus alittae]|uniref:DUF445 domain-containing protein n=1 Tax=Alkalimarinus alittae TaxID=2961619 RepID=A0ABY6N707_9ALTE|nr:hypothetical protein [Alkalimarinus alittae]UZE97893.1 hypothetical protein NKI27_09205 [Alkalimarinus alittae]
MDLQLSQFFESLHWANYFSLPIMAALIGWATNWVAIKMTFYPLTFRGVSPFLGWQGVVPRKAEKMASIVVDRTITRFGNMDDVFQKLEPEKITAQIISQIEPRIEEYIDEIMYEQQAVLWDNLPLSIKNKVYQWAHTQIPRRVEGLVADFGSELSELIDVKELFVEELKKHPELMVRIFKEVGDKEFSLIVKSGLLFGFMFGFIQIPLWLAYGEFWMLPVFGFIVGFATNWLALNVIFRPLYPRTFLGMTFQGLFLRRQDEVSDVWSRLVAEELITVERAANAMVFGRYANRTRAIIQKHIRPMLDQAGILKLVAQLTVGASGYVDLKRALNNKAIEVSVDPFHDPSFNKSRSAVVAAAMSDRMKSLSPPEFQDVLRPAFQEEEIQLMLIGGVLGAAAGIVQWLVIFS